MCPLPGIHVKLLFWMPQRDSLKYFSKNLLAIVPILHLLYSCLAKSHFWAATRRGTCARGCTAASTTSTWHKAIRVAARRSTFAWNGHAYIQQYAYLWFWTSVLCYASLFMKTFCCALFVLQRGLSAFQFGMGASSLRGSGVLNTLAQCMHMAAKVIARHWSML